MLQCIISTSSDVMVNKLDKQVIVSDSHWTPYFWPYAKLS